jgi:DNA-binding GntR family transcriptional regulator
MLHSVRNAKLVRNINDDHQALMQAILARNVPRAVELVQSHSNNTAHSVAGYWKLKAGV